VSYLREVEQIPASKITFENCTRESILGYLEWLSAERNCANTSVNQRLMILRSFLKFAGDTDCVYTSFGIEAANVPTRKACGREVDFLSEQSLKTLLAQHDVHTRAGHRNRFFMILMYDTAARCGELLQLNLKDLRINNSHPVVYLHGKGNKTRAVSLLPETVEHCRRYIKSFHDNYDDCEFVFYTTTHGVKSQMSVDTVALFLKNIGKPRVNNAPICPTDYIRICFGTPARCTFTFKVCLSIYSRSISVTKKAKPPKYTLSPIPRRKGLRLKKLMCYAAEFRLRFLFGLMTRI